MNKFELFAEQLVLLLEKAEELGLSSCRILRDCGKSFTLKDLREGRIHQISAPDFAAVSQKCVRQIREVGNRGNGRLMSREDVNWMCHALVTSLTLREAVERQVRIFELLDRKQGWISLAEDGDVATIELGVGPGEVCWERFFTTIGCVRYAHLFEWLIGGDLDATTMVADADSEEARLLAGMFAASFSFGEPCNGLRFPADRLDRPVVRTGAAMREFLKVYPYGAFTWQETGAGLSVKVEALYRVAILGGKPVPDVSSLAKVFGMSAATFRRHLEQENSSVRVIKDHVRHRIALDLLEGNCLHVDQIAVMLGFSCANAFARAFADWQGDTPTAYRRTLKKRNASRGVMDSLPAQSAMRYLEAMHATHH